MFSVKYHLESKSFECGFCRCEIDENHSCEALAVIVCRGKEIDGENCEICVQKRNARDYDNQWWYDSEGYCCCSFCNLRVIGNVPEMPKRCACRMYCNLSGQLSCKSCHQNWIEKNFLDVCSLCGFDG